MSIPSPSCDRDSQAHVAAVAEGRCLVELSSQTEITVGGRDAQEFLQRLCAADLRPLKPGEGLPAFFLDARGRAVALVDIYRLSEGFEIASAPGQSEAVLDHLERYRIREKVTFEDVSERRRHFRFFGRGAAERLRALLGPLPDKAARSHTEPLDIIASRSGDHAVLCVADGPITLRCIRRGRLDAFALVCDSEDADNLRRHLAGQGAVTVPPPVWEAVRIELGLPEFGRDISPDCLGPEVSPDPRAISTTKGCYLGQETVARLDAHGHLNRKLGGLRLGSAVPAEGTELLLRAKPVGRITSAAYSPHRREGLALAMLRREAWEPGTVLTWQNGEAVVTDLPFTDTR
ncbi:MAG: CAF17-like 4Fe-4S cluster assembly/insertion protein YgfZ [Thermogutta sp.]